MTGVSAVAAGTNHTIVLKQDGTVWTFGYNGSGQLGDGGTTNRNTPGQVTGLGAVSAVGAGSAHSLVILAGSGAMKSWGRNASGELGNGSTTPSNNPVSVSTVTAAVDVTACYFCSAARKANGTFYSWGDNGYGQLGLETRTAAPARRSPYRRTSRRWPSATTTPSPSSPTARSRGGAPTTTARSATAPRRTGTPRCRSRGRPPLWRLPAASTTASR